MKKLVTHRLTLGCIPLLVLLVGFYLFKPDTSFPFAHAPLVSQMENDERSAGIEQELRSMPEAAPESKEQKLTSLVAEFQSKVREKSTSSLDAYVFMMPLEQLLREDEEAFALFQEQVYEKLVTAEEPLVRMEDAFLFPIVAYVDQVAAQGLMIRVIEGTSAESEAYENYVVMLGEWMVNERGVQALLDLGKSGLPGLEKGMENFGHSGGDILRKSRELIQVKLEEMKKQGQADSSLSRSYAKILKHLHD